MTDNSILQTLIWTKDNLAATTKSIPRERIASWVNLAHVFPEAFERCAYYGYLKYQHEVNGRKHISDFELRDFMDSFKTKLVLARLQEVVSTDLLMFDMTEPLPECRHLL